MQLPRGVTLASALALAAALIAGCDKGPEQRGERNTAQPSGGASKPQAQATTPTTPANIGQPATQEEKKEGANPVQGQVDPKQGEQHRDFQRSGDAAGPKSPDTAPKTGG